MFKKALENSKLENLVLFRHGKAQRPYDAPDDFSRELIERGKKDSLAQAQRLNNLGFWPDLVLVSSALRASQTWDETAKIYLGVKYIVTRDLYLASPELYMRLVIECGAKNVMLIAHDPGLHDLSKLFLKGNELTPDAQYLRIDMPTSGIAWFRNDAAIKSHMRFIAHLRPIRTAD